MVLLAALLVQGAFWRPPRRRRQRFSLNPLTRWANGRLARRTRRASACREGRRCRSCASPKSRPADSAWQSTRFGTEELGKTERAATCRSVISGSSEAWYRARFGTGRSRVQIPPSRPLTSRDPPVATTRTRTDRVSSRHHAVHRQRTIDKRVRKNLFKSVEDSHDLRPFVRRKSGFQSTEVSGSATRSPERQHIYRHVSDCRSGSNGAAGAGESQPAEGHAD